ncbi:hypothetical protein MNB_SV-15-184 [hydrothermal vent metagenome]|uniref:Uncharacterized protein n=1 Tax=hydrothermal vent metagenome TaxID=652676 RepID=A0A1W1EJL6_9ZZZZ
MKKLIFIPLITIFINANDLVIDIAKNTLMTSQKSFESGSHDIGDNQENKTLFVASRYNFDSSSNINYFLSGSIGVGEYTNDITSLDIKSTVIGIGGGVRLKLNENNYISLNSGITYSNISTNITKDLDAITYQIDMMYDYKKTINDYDIYINALSGYYSTKVDDLSDKSSDSILSHIKVGVYSPELIQIHNLPFKVELYAQETFLGKDIADNLDMNNFTTIGMAFHLYTDTIVPLVDNLYLDINYVKGDNIEGLHIGLALSF